MAFGPEMGPKKRTRECYLDTVAVFQTWSQAHEPSTAKVTAREGATGNLAILSSIGKCLYSWRSAFVAAFESSLSRSQVKITGVTISTCSSELTMPPSTGVASGFI